MPNFFIAFDESTGAVTSVGQNVDGKSIVVDDELALKIINGERQTTEFSVIWKNDKFVLKDNSQIDVVEHEKTTSTEFYQIPAESTDEKIVFEQHTDENKWIVKINDSVVVAMKETGAVAQRFYITEYNQPNVLIDTVLINLSEGLHEIKGNAKSQCSVYCKNIYNNYVHKEIKNATV